MKQFHTIDTSWAYKATIFAQKNALPIRNAALIQHLQNEVNKCQIDINFEDLHAH